MAASRRFLDTLSQIRHEVRRLEAAYHDCQKELEATKAERDEALTLALQLQNDLDAANERILRLQKWEQLG